MNEAVIVDALRTPIARRKGALSRKHPVDLLGYLLKKLLERNSLDAVLVDDVIAGCVDQVGEQAVNVARNAWLSAGLPESVPATTLDRQCGSSLQALHFAAQGVLAGVYDIAIACGVESMTRVPMMSTLQVSGSPVTEDLKRRYQLTGPWFNQAVGAEMIAKEMGFSREDLDKFSLSSHQLAHEAREAGRFDAEVIPVPVENEAGETDWFSQDEGIRPDTNMEQLSKLRTAFDGLELITAGNASQISDGASASLIMSKQMAEKLGLRPRARFVSFAVVGVDPITMLKGPIPATGKALEKAGLGVDDIDLFEVNEAFAPVVMAWQQEWNVPREKVNVNGGAIALGHPLGATGTRITATLLNELEKRNQRYGLMAICEGGGMANATIIERI
jgi:acetyl-CoA acyltransferase